GSTSGGPEGKSSGGWYSKSRSKGERFEKFSSLDINLNLALPEGRAAQTVLNQFQSLGEGTPSLDIRVVDSRRVGLCAWGVGLLVGLVGVMITRRPARTKFLYVLSIVLLSILLPLIVPPTLILARAFDAAFVAAGMLLVYFLAVGFVRWL